MKIEHEVTTAPAQGMGVSRPAGVEAHRCNVCGAGMTLYHRLREVDIFGCICCEHKQSVLHDGTPPESYLPEYYSKIHENWFKHPNLPLFRNILEQLERLDPRVQSERLSVIDVGCGDGALLRFLKEQRPNLRLTGLDLTGRVPGEGIEFIREDVMNFRAGTAYDVVVSLATIEHLRDIQGFASRLLDLTGPGGLVVVMTVNSTGFLYGSGDRLNQWASLSFAAERLYDKHHVNHFSEQSLRDALEKAGFQFVLRFNHNFPARAVDLPGAMPGGLKLVLRAGILAVFYSPFLFKPMLQTVICRKPASA